MKKILILFLACFWMLCSCDKSIKSSMLDARLEMVTDVVDDGGNMMFKVFCNQNSFVVRNLSCEFSDDNVISNDRTYSVSDGYCLFTFSGVSVKDDHNSVLSFNICGENDYIIPVSARYYCQTFSPEMSLTASTVSSGSRLGFVITSNHPTFTLRRISSTASFTGAPQSGVYNSGELFSVRIMEEAGSLTSTHTLTVVVYDELLECEKTLTAEFKVK